MSFCGGKRDRDDGENSKASDAALASDRFRYWFGCLFCEEILLECIVQRDNMDRLLLPLLLRSDHV